MQSLFQKSCDEFSLLPLNIQSANARFNNVLPVINDPTFQGLYFGAICLQDKWTSSDSDYNSLHTKTFVEVANVLSVVG